MEPQRLFKVADDDRLFTEHGEVQCVVQFASVLSQEQQRIFQELVDSWAFMMPFGAMPDYSVFDLVYSKLTGLQKREMIFRSSLMKAYSGVSFEGKRAQWQVDLDKTDQRWLDILLNCLEGYHVQIVPVESVELSADVEPI